MVGADADPAGVGTQVIDPIRDRLAQFGIGKVMGMDPGGRAFAVPFPAHVLVLADQLLLLRVHADHRAPVVWWPLDCSLM